MLLMLNPLLPSRLYHLPHPHQEATHYMTAEIWEILEIMPIVEGLVEGRVEVLKAYGQLPYLAHKNQVPYRIIMSYLH